MAFAATALEPAARYGRVPGHSDDRAKPARPQSRLSVNGGVTIGSSYAGVTAAPTNGLAVSGTVGIGTTTTPTGVTAAVNGVVQVAGTGSEPCAMAQVGAMRYNSGGGYFEMCTYR
jgi:hypothetical protein